MSAERSTHSRSCTVCPSSTCSACEAARGRSSTSRCSLASPRHRRAWLLPAGKQPLGQGRAGRLWRQAGAGELRAASLQAWLPSSAKPPPPPLAAALPLQVPLLLFSSACRPATMARSAPHPLAELICKLAAPPIQPSYIKASIRGAARLTRMPPAQQAAAQPPPHGLLQILAHLKIGNAGAPCAARAAAPAGGGPGDFPVQWLDG